MSKKIHDSMLELIGNTPMVRLNKICKGLDSEILVKLEYMNPSGSLKDRIALEMIRAAEKSGELKPGATLVESSTGNTGFALSSVGRAMGYNVRIYETMPGKAGSEKKKMMENVGAEVRLMEPDDIEHLQERSIAGSEVELPGRQLCLEAEQESGGKIWWARQFANQANTEAHYQTAQEILEQTDGKLDVFVQSIGTGGSVYGIAKIAEEGMPDVKVIGIQPASSRNSWTAGMEMGFGIGLIGKLPCPPDLAAALLLGIEAELAAGKLHFRPGNAALLQLLDVFGLHQAHFGADVFHHLLLFRTGLAGHGFVDADVVAHGPPHAGQREAGVARAGFHEGRTGLELAGFLAGPDHLECDPVLQAAGGIHVLQLDQDFRVQALADLVQPDHRGVPDQFQHAVMDFLAHFGSLIAGHSRGYSSSWPMFKDLALSI